MLDACGIEELAKLDDDITQALAVLARALPLQAALWDAPAVDDATDRAMRGLAALRVLTETTAQEARKLWDERRGD